MKKDEIQKQLNDLEERLFIINMVDHWQREDYEAYDRLFAEKKKLEEELEKIENEEK